jgi:hypothetical protein
VEKGLLCLRTQTLEGNTVGALPEKMQALLKRKENFWLIGFATCFSLFAEEKVSSSGGVGPRVEKVNMDAYGYSFGVQKRRAELGMPFFLLTLKL